MSSRVLILTHPGDAHAFAVAEALERKGAEALLWHTPDFPHRSGETLRFTGERLDVELRGPDLSADGDGWTSVWNRRPVFALDEDLLHPADLAFARQSCETFRKGLMSLLAPDAFWVNPPEAVAVHTKPRAHRAAVEAGFRVPDTLYGNDPETIRRFVAEQGGRVIYKPMVTSFWRSGDQVEAPYANLVTAEMLGDDDLLQAAPGIYQAPVPKAFEVRLTALGDSLLAARIDSQETESGHLDWRRAYGELHFERIAVPERIATATRNLLDRLGFNFAAVDLIVTPKGEWVFLEANQSGQFLFLESDTGLPLLDACAEMLLQGRRDFSLHKGTAEVRFDEVSELLEERMTEARSRHRAAPDPSFDEGDGDDVGGEVAAGAAVKRQDSSP